MPIDPFVPPRRGIDRLIQHKFWVAALLIWAGVVTAGLQALHSYERTPGADGDARSVWPAGSGVRPDPVRPTLIMLAHPFCPCTQASLKQLAKIVEAGPGAAAVHVFFFLPEGADDAWRTSWNRRRAAEIPGAALHDDRGGKESSLFGAETSGHVMVYDRDGRLLFSGGVSSGRGAEGENAGGDAATALLQGKTPRTRQAPVFGCPIRDVPESTDEQ